MNKLDVLESIDKGIKILINETCRLRLGLIKAGTIKDCTMDELRAYIFEQARPNFTEKDF